MAPDRPATPIDADDPRLDAYRFVRERDVVGRDGRFVAEGAVVVRLLVSPRSRFATESVLVAENRLAGLAPLLAAVPATVPIYSLPAAAMADVAGFHVHRGLLAIGLRGSADRLSLPAPGHPALVLGLVGLANHDNVGAAFRNAAAFGADAVLLDSASCDPLYRKAIRVSVGACLTVPWSRAGSPGAMLDTLGEAGFSVFALAPGGDRLLGDVRWPDRTALVVGAEGPGLPHDLLGRVEGVRIAMAPGFDSLNVATAAGIALHAAASARRHD